MNDNLVLILGGGIGVLIVCAAIAILASRKKPLYKKKGQLLLLNEQRFLTALLQALPSNTIVSVKVRLLDIVSVTHHVTGKNLDHELADYSVDFVLLDRETTNVKLCIEMDMDSKTASERMARNTHISRALRKAAIPHLRLPLVRFYDPLRLRQVIESTLNPQRV